MTQKPVSVFLEVSGKTLFLEKATATDCCVSLRAIFTQPCPLQGDAGSRLQQPSRNCQESPRTAETVSLSNWTSDRSTVPQTSCYVGDVNLGFSELLLVRYCTTCSPERGSLVGCLTHNSCPGTWPWITIKAKPERSTCKKQNMWSGMWHESNRKFYSCLRGKLSPALT